MNTVLRNAMVLAAMAVATSATAQVIFYEHDDFQGRTFTAEQQVDNFKKQGFNDRASSVVVLNHRWEACENANFGGRCIILRPGRYSSLSTMGFNDRISSVRLVSENARYDDNRYAPQAVPVYDNRRRNSEHMYEATVTSVRAVTGPPTQRCWIEREQVTQERSGANVPGALVGALLGGVLGHQVGGGRGNDLATAGGAVAGAAIGANAGRDRGGQSYGQDVQRCASTPSQARPEYWDVTYEFRGIEHRIQTAVPPGSTITVNSNGEPRV